ncbi:hypothetical protein GJAV_G00107740 [Gymnothorax javanicus]|nr:hypothetical protein GJAV_G00107740 [Gymnothorax javanicus]
MPETTFRSRRCCLFQETLQRRFQKLCSPEDCRMAWRVLFGLSVQLFCLSDLAGSVEFEQPSSIVARAGEDAEIKCSHSEGDYHNMFWYRRAVQDRILVLIGSAYSSEAPACEDQFKARFRFIRETMQRGALHISALAAEDTALYFCAARFEQYFGGGTRLTVVDPQHVVTPPTVTVLPPAPQEVHQSRKRKSEVTLVCVVMGFYPEQIQVSWEVNGVGREGGQADSEPLLDKSAKTYSLSSQIKIPAQDWLRPQNVFTCVTHLFNGSHALTASHSISGEKGCFSAEKWRRGLVAGRLWYTVLICKSVLYMIILTVLMREKQGMKNKRDDHMRS